MDLFIKNGRVIELTDDESNQIKEQGTHVTEITKNMTKEELEAFKKERFQKFIMPLMEHNQNNLKD